MIAPKAPKGLPAIAVQFGVWNSAKGFLGNDPICNRYTTSYHIKALFRKRLPPLRLLEAGFLLGKWITQMVYDE